MSPTYERVEWTHDFADEPRSIYSELDDERYETRKIEVFEVGRIVKGSEDRPERGCTGLAVLPVPGIEEVNAISEEEFHTEEIGVAEFEDLWKSYDERGRPYSPECVAGRFYEFHLDGVLGSPLSFAPGPKDVIVAPVT
jgi:hypothetical protein